jgi:ribulose 1,5-bisphosphate carboxylase large subunit-like protein
MDPLFWWNPQLARDDYALVTYYIESFLAPDCAAESMAREQSVTATGQDVLKRPVELSAASARVFAVEPLGESPTTHLPFYLLGEPVGEVMHQGNYHAARVTLAFPLAHSVVSLTRLWNACYGELPRHGILNAFRVLDIEFPPWALDQFAGPRYGVAGLRKRFNVHDRPFFCRSSQPPCGFTTDHAVEIGEAVLGGGFDLVKDDELTTDDEVSPFLERVAAMARLARRMSDQTGEPKGFIANAIDSPLLAADQVRAAERLGADGVLLAPAIQGIEFLRDIRRLTAMLLLAHNTGEDALTRHPKVGVHPALLIKLYRLCGADIVMLPGATATAWDNRDETRACMAAASGPLGAAAPALPILAGAKRPTALGEYRDLLGSVDFMVIAATALNEHPHGLAAGARQFRDAWEQLQVEALTRAVG